MQRFWEKYPLAYTPLLMATTTSVFILFALIPFPILGRTPPVWIWLSLAAILPTGLILQLGSRRVIHMHFFGTIAHVLATAIYGLSIWMLITVNQTAADQRFMAVLVTGCLFLIIIVWFVLDQRKAERATMPCGPQGRLNTRTGLIVDKGYRAIPHSDVERGNKWMGLVLRASPLIAGLTFAFTRGLTVSGKMAVLALAMLVMATLTAIVGGAFLSYVVASLRWEGKHGKGIYVKP